MDRSSKTGIRDFSPLSSLSLLFFSRIFRMGDGGIIKNPKSIQLDDTLGFGCTEEASRGAEALPFSRPPSRWPRGNNSSDQSFISYRSSSSMWKCDHLEAASKYNSAETGLVGVPVRCFRVGANGSYIFYYWPMEPVPGGGTGVSLPRWVEGGFDS